MHQTTVEGELGVANSLDKMFLVGLFPDPCGCAPLPGLLFFKVA
jgi:hypothetical protein